MEVFQQNVANLITNFAQKLIDANAVCFARAAVTHNPLQNYWSVLLWQPVEAISGRSAGFILSSGLCAPFACVRMNCDINGDSAIVKHNGPCLHLYLLLSTCDQMLCFCVWKYKCNILRCVRCLDVCVVHMIYFLLCLH